MAAPPPPIVCHHEESEWLFGRGCAFLDQPKPGIGEREEGTELNTHLQAMAYRRSITSSDDDSTGPKFTKERTDSSESAQSGTSAKYRWHWDYSSKRRGRLPESPSPSPVESSEDDKENIHPALMDVGEQAESEEEEDTSSYPVYLDPPQPIEISDDSLVEIIQRAAQSSYNGPPGFEPGSSAAAAMQHHLNHAHRRIEQLEEEVGQRQYAQEAVQAENVELADRVAQLVVLLAVVVLGVLVAALLVRGWL